MSPPTVRCRILGQAEIHTRGIRLTPESERQFGLALYFCAQAGREVSRDEIAHLFWPTHTIEAARHCLRQAVYRLRVLGVAVRNNAKAAVLDTHFIDADYAPVVAEGASAAAYLKLDDVDILPGFAPRFSRTFARWVEDFRGELAGRMRRGLVRAISEMRARGRYAEVERLCRFCLRLDPLNEEATLALAESVALAGGKAEAVGLIERYESEVGRYRADLRVSSGLLRERISDRLIRRSQALFELPMIGREADVERVMSAFQGLRANRAVSYVVTGVAGVGKTRLATECCRMAELQGSRILTIATQPSSRTQALFAVSELVNGLLQMPGAIGCAPPALECLRALSAPAPMRREASLVLEAEGEARFAMVRWSILDVLDAILSEGPLVIHVDDAHQLDDQSQSILHDAIRTNANRPLLLLFTIRKHEQNGVEAFNRLMSISSTHELLPLSDSSCETLVTRFCVTNEESLDEGVRARIIQLTGGNPFFLVELLKHRAELLSEELPITVQALLEDRILRLSPIALTVLRAAAILGLSSTADRLNRMVERRTSEVLLALVELHAAGMLSAFEDGACCRHDSIREAVLRHTPKAARVLLHRRAARLLGREALRAGGVALLWESVHHWRSAGAREQGVRLALLLAKQLLSVGLARDALAVLEDLETNPIQLQHKQRLVMLRRKARAARMLRDWPKVTTIVNEWNQAVAAEGRSARSHGPMELMQFEAHYQDYETFGLLPVEIQECVESESATLAHRLAAGTLTMIKADNDGDEAAAKRIFRAVTALRPVSKRERIDWLTAHAVFHASFGNLKETPSFLDQLVNEALTIAHPASRAFHLRRACFGLSRYGDVNRARELLISCLETFDRLELYTQGIYCIEELGFLELWDGNAAQVLTLTERVRGIRAATGNIFADAVAFELQSLLALETQDRSLLPTFRLAEGFESVLSQSKRGRQTALLLRVTHEAMLGQPDLPEELGKLLELYSEMRCRGYQDYVVAASVGAMLALDQPARASALIADYETARRELRPLSPRLQALFARCKRA